MPTNDLMTLLELIASADLRGGGPIEAVLQRARVFREAGHNVELATLDSPRENCDLNQALPIHRLGPGRLKYGYTGRLAPWLRNQTGRFDAVIVNGLWNYASFAAWLGLRHSRTPYFVFPHGMLDPWFKRSSWLKHLKKWLYWPWAEYRVLRDARGVLFTCEEECRLARQSFWLYQCNERIVGLGIASPAGDPQKQISQFFVRFPQLRDKRLLLFLGRIHPKKGCDLLIRAYADVLNSSQFPGSNPLHLVLAGPDQLQWGHKLRSLAQTSGISDRVTFTGMLTGDLKLGALRAAEVFVLPSHQENFGIAVVEALACRVPVLISNKVNIWREIEEDGAGIIDNDDAEGTRHLLMRWFSLTSEAQALIRDRAFQCFAQRFEIQRATAKLLTLLRQSC